MIVFGIFLVLIFILSLVSHRLKKTILTAPMIFTTAGIIVFLVIPELALVEVNNKTVLLLAELALAFTLFGDASRIQARSVWRDSQLPDRLLLIGMPLAILTGTVVALLVLTSLTLWEAAILAVILAPTDASLGASIATSPRVPDRIRKALNIESGLNDGLSVPFLMLFIALARVDSPLENTSWILYTLQVIGLGLLVGGVMGWGSGWLMGKAAHGGWTGEKAEQLGLLAVVVLTYFIAHEIGGNEFIAAFVAGLLVKVGFVDAGERMLDFSEAWGELLVYFVFFIFGAIAAPLLPAITFSVVVYAALSLTLVRMLPVAISMLGIKLQRSSVLFMGWFGPRGLASIVLGFVYLKEEANLPGEPLILLTVAATVLLSVFAHGISTAPAINRYGTIVEALTPGAPEFYNSTAENNVNVT
jgi:NhaP-type Na+/H+ or K+/H+ antiporter